MWLSLLLFSSPELFNKFNSNQIKEERTANYGIISQYFLHYLQTLFPYSLLVLIPFLPSTLLQRRVFIFSFFIIHKTCYFILHPIHSLLLFLSSPPLSLSRTNTFKKVAYSDSQAVLYSSKLIKGGPLPLSPSGDYLQLVFYLFLLNQKCEFFFVYSYQCLW